MEGEVEKKEQVSDCSFRLSHYRTCLQLALEKGYTFSTMRQASTAPPTDREIILRHDIDHSLPLARNFADIEAELGVRATYFIRIHASGYNPTSFIHYGVLKELAAQGHEIALHYEPGFYELFNESAKGGLERDKSILEGMVGKRIEGVSSHEAAKSGSPLAPEDVQASGLAYDAYSPRFTKDMKYISDSSSRWREGCMCNHIRAGVPRLCILTHPIWWFGESPLENY